LIKFVCFLQQAGGHCLYNLLDNKICLKYGYSKLDSIYRETAWENLHLYNDGNSSESLYDLIPSLYTCVGETNNCNLRILNDISKLSTAVPSFINSSI
jgi:hypothetical protein